MSSACCWPFSVTVSRLCAGRLEVLLRGLRDRRGGQRPPRQGQGLRAAAEGAPSSRRACRRLFRSTRLRLAIGRVKRKKRKKTRRNTSSATFWGRTGRQQIGWGGRGVRSARVRAAFRDRSRRDSILIVRSKARRSRRGGRRGGARARRSGVVSARQIEKTKKMSWHPRERTARRARRNRRAAGRARRFGAARSVIVGVEASRAARMGRARAFPALARAPSRLSRRRARAISAENSLQSTTCVLSRHRPARSFAADARAPTRAPPRAWPPLPFLRSSVPATIRRGTTRGRSRRCAPGKTARSRPMRTRCSRRPPSSVASLASESAASPPIIGDARRAALANIRAFSARAAVPAAGECPSLGALATTSTHAVCVGSRERAGVARRPRDPRTERGGVSERLERR